MKQMWEIRQIRCLILTSLLIQASLTFLAPIRKRLSAKYLKTIIWLLYLLADAIAIYIIGLISRDNNNRITENSEVYALWAPFLLLHLGGPDTITAFALEDNELWRRHVFQLASQVVLTLYVFGRSLQHTNHHLWIPTVLMFIDGFIKYFERTCALFFSSRDSFRESLVMRREYSPNYQRLMEEYYSAKNAHIPTEFEHSIHVRFNVDHRPSAPMRYHRDVDLIVFDAYMFYEMCKTLLADGFLSLKDRHVSREFFLNKLFDEAYKVIQIELNLIYDAFYTKLFLLRGKARPFARILCFILVIVAFVLFCLEWDLKVNETDAIVTYILFSGALALDVCAFVMFIMSDWWIIIPYQTSYVWVSHLMRYILRWVRWMRLPHPDKRWSESISTFNLLEYCFSQPPLLYSIFKFFFRIKYVKDFLDGLVYVKDSEKVSHRELLSFVFKEIRNKAEQASDVKVAKEVFDARGNLVLEDDYYLASEILSPWTVDVDYDESVLVWHLATEICYHTNTMSHEIDDDAAIFSKTLSDYMLCLIMRQQSLLSRVVGMADIRFHDTCGEAEKFMEEGEKFMEDLNSKNGSKFLKFIEKVMGVTMRGKNFNCKRDSKVKVFIEKVMDVRATVEPMISRNKKSKSVLYNAVRLAHQLEMFGQMKWEVTSKVWVELLCYAAVRCSPRSHVAQLSSGGELITLVWLYMAHLGIGERFLHAEEYGWNYRLMIHE